MGWQRVATTEQLALCSPWKSTQPIAVLLREGFEQPRDMLAPQCEVGKKRKKKDIALCIQ